VPDFLSNGILNKAGLNDARQLGAFWVKFIANALIGFGVFS
jgi:hypothetical protein